MFHPRWVGWYAAIRTSSTRCRRLQPYMPANGTAAQALRESMLIGTGGYDGGIVRATLMNRHLR